MGSELWFSLPNGDTEGSAKITSERPEEGRSFRHLVQHGPGDLEDGTPGSASERSPTQDTMRGSLQEVPRGPDTETEGRMGVQLGR
jgi:hypothetical protein